MQIIAQPPYNFSNKYFNATVAPASPTQNTWYTLLDTTLNCSLLQIAVVQSNGEAAAKTIAVRITIDGIVLTQTQSANNNTSYYVSSIQANGVTGIYIGTTQAAPYLGIIGKSIKVEMRYTSAAGTNQTLTGFIHYLVQM